MTMQTDLARRLSHVLWIGGSPCSGKSTISHAIAQIYVFLDYHVDAWSRNHFARRVATGDATARAFLQMNMEQRWIERSLDALVQETVASWSGEFQLVLEDLLALPQENIIIAEGNFFPASVAPYLSSLDQAIWLVPTDAFCEQGRRQRWNEQIRRMQRQNLFAEDKHTEQRMQNIIARDCQLARHVRQQAETLQMPLCEVDGSRSRAEMMDLVERHFDPYVSKYFTQRK